MSHIFKHIECSTAHITCHDDILLTKWCTELKTLLSYSFHTYGYIIVIEESLPEGFNKLLSLGFSKSFITLLEYAIDHKCTLLVLDRDADIIPNLPTNEW